MLHSVNDNLRCRGLSPVSRARLDVRSHIHAVLLTVSHLEASTDDAPGRLDPGVEKTCPALPFVDTWATNGIRRSLFERSPYINWIPTDRLLSLALPLPRIPRLPRTPSTNSPPTKKPSPWSVFFATHPFFNTLANAPPQINQDNHPEHPDAHVTSLRLLLGSILSPVSPAQSRP